MIEAALRARCHYLDVTGEALVTIETFARYADSELDARRVRDADIVLVPSMAFFGALGDLLATAALSDLSEADEISIAFALDSWKPTRGTRLAGERRAGRRVVFEKGRIEVRPPADQIPTATWEFPSPFGRQDVVGEFPTVDLVTMSRHLRVAKISTYLNLTPIRDLRDPNTSGPQPADETGRSAQIFLVDVVARQGDRKRSAVARGRDIYAITAPIVVEAARSILDGRFKRKGIGAPAEIFDARDFLGALAPEHLTIQIP